MACWIDSRLQGLEPILAHVLHNDFLLRDVGSHLADDLPDISTQEFLILERARRRCRRGYISQEVIVVGEK